MSKEVPWSKIILEEFVMLSALTEDEEKVLRCHVAGWSIQKISMAFCISESTTSRIIRRLKDKYDQVQPYSPLLPPRKKSVRV